MSNFWLNKIDPQAGNRPQQTVSILPTAVSRAWWDDSPQQAPLDAPVAPTQHTVLPQAPERPSKAMSAGLTDKCPACWSGNYMPVMGAAVESSKCFDCGYPVVQSTSGIGVQSAPGQTAQPSRQISGSGGLSNNFNPGSPGHIIAHM